MDGREAGVLQPGESLLVQASEHPIPCINRSPSLRDKDAVTSMGKGRDHWVRDINTLLGFNVSFKANGGAQ